jgi:hypothetical protein
MRTKINIKIKTKIRMMMRNYLPKIKKILTITLLKWMKILIKTIMTAILILFEFNRYSSSLKGKNRVWNKNRN